MVKEPVELLQIELPCDSTAPAVARSSLLEADNLGEATDDALLVTSELVTNAVLHSGCEDESIEVHVLRNDEAVVISVSDPGASGLEAESRGPGIGSRIGQYGLFVVSQVARRWGAARENGYTVWAELPFAG